MSLSLRKFRVNLYRRTPLKRTQKRAGAKKNKRRITKKSPWNPVPAVRQTRWGPTCWRKAGFFLPPSSPSPPASTCTFFSTLRTSGARRPLSQARERKGSLAEPEMGGGGRGRGQGRRSGLEVDC